MSANPTRIGVMIGNGFDIALGLKTKYEHFLSEYKKANEKSPSKDIRWLCSQIDNAKGNNEHPQWSDAEVAFANLPFGSGMNAIDVYSKCSRHFTNSFIDYLKTQNARFTIPKDQRLTVRNEFIEHLFDIVGFMRSGHKAQSRLLVGDNGARLDFLNFNYTDTLDQILDFSESSQEELPFPADKGLNGKVTFSKVCHVHGDLNGSSIFGVDSEKLISDKNVRDYCTRIGGILKGRCEEQAGFTGRKRGMNIIDSLNVLLTFGLSFGESDAEWWHKIFYRVKDRGMQLIVCPYYDAESSFPQGGCAINEFHANEKKRVFRSVLASDKNISAIIENFSASQVIVLNPSTVENNPCDYLHLANIAARFTR